MARTIAVAGYRAWHAASRSLLAEEVPPEDVQWLSGGEADASMLDPERYDEEDGADLATEPAERSPATVLAACHRDADRFAVLYRVWWRLRHGEPHLLELATDPDVRRLHALARGVSRDIHHCKAYVRFRAVGDDDGAPRFIAWHRPDHDCLHLAAGFFRARFGGHRWTILTPQRSAAWDGQTLALGPGITDAPPGDDALEDAWRTYYAAIFNPARANPRCLDRRLQRRYRATLPEARLIPGLLAGAAERVERMAVALPGTAQSYVPAGAGLAELRAALPACRGCPLHAACAPLAGSGPADAAVVVVLGQPPSPAEDAVIDGAVRAAGLQRASIYVTAAVKHPSAPGAAPAGAHLAACRPWLAELAALPAAVVLCLGAAAALAVLGRRVPAGGERDAWHRGPADRRVLVTAHPAEAERSDDGRRRLIAAFVAVAECTVARTAAGTVS